MIGRRSVGAHGANATIRAAPVVFAPKNLMPFAINNLHIGYQLYLLKTTPG